MPQIRVMVVDGDVRVRRALAGYFSSEFAEAEVVAATSSMVTALSRLEHSAADILVINQDLLETDSADTAGQIFRAWQTIKMVVYSAGQPRPLKHQVAIAPYLDRLEQLETPQEAEELAKTVVRHLQKSISRGLPRTTNVSHLELRAGREPASPKVIVIGVSTGGPTALADLLPGLPADWNVPVLIVQHMLPALIPALAERLGTLSGLDVRVATHGEVISGAVCRIAAGDKHLEIQKTNSGIVTLLTDTPPENSCRPAADPLFRSAARAFGPEVLGVVLTGMGRDGTAGAQEIVRQGGSVVVQDEATSVVWGMPGSVAEARLASDILPIQQIAPFIVRRCRIEQKN
ncbi:MAG: chemotaxis protein CheB [bacterium]